MNFYILIVIIAIIIFLNLWLEHLSPRKSFTGKFEFPQMSIDNFFALCYYVASKLKWGIIDLNDNCIKFITRQSLGSWGEVIEIEYLDGTSASFTCKYLTQKTGFGQLNRNYNKFIKNFQQIQNQLSDEDLKEILQTLIDNYGEFYKEIHRDDDEWIEV